MAFVNAFFANNKDLSSQIGILIILANKATDNSKFVATGNIIVTTSIKCRYVTWAVLASELYTTVYGVDLLIVISATLNWITNWVRIPNILTIICTDSYSLYKCLVKLGTMKEKRLMIDIMALQESYKQHELTEIW